MNVIANASRRIDERIQTITGIFSKVPDNIALTVPTFLNLFRVIKPTSSTDTDYDFINFSELDSDTESVPDPTVKPFKVLAEATITATGVYVFKTINFEATITDITDDSETGGQTTAQKVIAQMNAGFQKANSAVISNLSITSDEVFINSMLVKFT